MEGEMESVNPRYMTAASIISSLGFGTEENMANILRYASGICRIDDASLFEEPFMAARIDDARLYRKTEEQGLGGYTRMEQLFILSLQDTIRQSGIRPDDPDCTLILSTTKGNIDRLAGTDYPAPEVYLSSMAGRIAGYFGFVHRPIVISNACISGVSALIVAARLIEAGRFRHALVAGGDLLTRFVVTGFQSFKAVSPRRCRPYDRDRDGLSLGEACGSLLMTADRELVHEQTPVLFKGGAITNDANHISGPSRTGDGLSYAIGQALHEANLRGEELSFINAHGTATLYNDEMESKAFRLAGVDGCPVNSLKPYWGHTLGASGIIEVIACMEELRRGELFGTLGYQHCGTPYPLQVNACHQKAGTRHCLKTASGFGGCNAAILLSRAEICPASAFHPSETMEKYSWRSIIIREGNISVDGKTRFEAAPDLPFPDFIRSAYKFLALDDRKFYKMDDLCKLGYMATAFLLAEQEEKTGCNPLEIGVVLANRSSSLDTDLRHQHLIDTSGDRGASPAIFVYTLPNVVMGELCIRYRIQGENTFFIADAYPDTFIHEYVRIVMEKQKLKACLAGWCELLEGHYEARFEWIERIE